MGKSLKLVGRSGLRLTFLYAILLWGYVAEPL